MKQLRKIIFWIHLGTGLAAGLGVALMGATGAIMAFEPQLLEWAERASSTVAVPEGKASRLPVDQLLERAKGVPSQAAPIAVTVYADPRAAVRVSTGRRDGVHVNPYTGEARVLAGAGWRSLFQTMIDWHRALGFSGEKRAIGRAIIGACNAAFFFLALSGLYLWWPRRWSDRALRLSIWFRRGLSGRARDWNWHNATGFWSLSVLLVVTASGMMISYAWASNLISRFTGDPIPAARGPAAAAPVTVPPPAPGVKPLPLDTLFATAAQQVPGWKTISLRMGQPGRPQPGDRAARPPASTFSIKEAKAWPLFSSVQVSLDPVTGKVLRREAFQDLRRDRRIRSWLRFLHTGEALGWPGQLVAGIVSLGATLLVWTGFALAWRRFFPRRL
jgi:uncharacterized iron-regulated membrane protein